MAEELKIIIDADVSKAQTGLDSVALSAQKTADNLNRVAPAATDASTGLDKISNSSQRIVPAATNVATATDKINQGLQKVPSAASDADKGIQTVTDVLNSFAKQGKLSIEVVEKSMSDLRTIIKQTTDPNDVNKLKDAFSELSKRLQALKIQGGLEQQLQGVARSTRIAQVELEEMGRSLTSFASGSGRAIDGIGQLVFSFERLSGEAGGLTGALGALGETLLSPAGIIVAVTAVIGIFEALSNEIFNTSDSLEKSKAAYDSYIKKLEDVKNQINDLKSALDFSNQLANVNAEINNIPKVVNLSGFAVAQRELTQQIIDRQNQVKQSLSDIEKDEQLSADKRAELQVQLNKELFDLQQEETESRRKTLLIERQINDTRLKEQRDAADKRVSVAEQELANMQATIDKAIAIQKELQGSFIIPADVKIDDTSLQQFDEIAKALIKRKQDLLIQLKNIDVKEAELGIDLTGEKTTIKLQIAEIDKELLKKRFDEAKAFLDQQAIGFKIDIPLDIPVPKLKPRIDDADLKESIRALAKSLTLPLQLVLDEPTLLEAEQKLTAIFSAFGEKNIFTEAGKNAGQKFSQALLDAVQVFQKGFKINPALNIDDVVNSLKQSLAPLNQITLNLFKSEDFKSAIRDLERLHDAGVAAGEAAQDAFIKAGLSAEDAAKASQAIEDSFGGITKSAGDAAEAISGTLGNAVGDLINAFATGQNPAKAFFNAIIQSLTQVIAKIIQAQIEQAILNSLFKAAQSSFNPLSLLGSLGLGFEKGGDPPVGRASMVGEKGRELIVPKSQMHVFPHNVTESIVSTISHNSERIKSNIHYHYDYSTRIINNYFNSVSSSLSSSIANIKSFSPVAIANALNLPKLATGGAVFAPTLALLGEGFGISRSNPEFVGTRDQLKGIQGGQFDLNVTVGGEISMDMGKLLLEINRQQRSQLRTNGKKPF